MPRPGALLYLQSQINAKGGFFAEWKALGEKDKDDLKRWAEEEMDYLGMAR